jgi:hypothetical protein
MLRLISVLLIVPGLALAQPPALTAGQVAGQVIVGEGVQKVVIYLDEPGPPHAPALKRVRIARGPRFLPPHLIVPRGTRLEFLVEAPTYHHLFTVSRGAPANELDLGLMAQGMARTAELRLPGEVDVYCDIHPELALKLLVLPSGLAAPVKIDGSYALSGLPEGNRTIAAWSPLHEPERRQVRIQAGQVLRLDFSLRPRRGPVHHLNRNGEPYASSVRMR